MKTISLFFKFAVILLFAGLSLNTAVAQTEKKNRLEMVYDISPSGSLMIPSVTGSNIEILTWDRNEVKIIGEMTYEGNGSKEDINKLLYAFNNMTAESSKDALTLNLNPIVSAYLKKRSFRKSDLMIVLYNGDETSTLVANHIKTFCTIWIPATLDVKIDSKFGKIKMASVKGNVNLTISNNDLVMGDFGESGIFNIKYSTASIGSGGTSEFKVYNSRINAAELKNLTIDSKFSKFNIAKANDISLNSYQDTYDFGMLNDIVNVSARYSTIHIENNKKLEDIISQRFGNEDVFIVIERNEDVFIFEYRGTEQIVNIPSRIQNRNVIFIGAHAFSNKNLTDVTIPNSVTSIRAHAFSYNKLTSVIIPNSVTAISADAFVRNLITRITIGANVQFQQYKDFNGITTNKVAFDNAFDDFYIKQGRKAGTYTYSDGRWNMAEQ